MEAAMLTDLASMVWIEARKAWRSRMPLWTALGSLFLPLGIGFLIFVARNPQISRELGLISAKANLVAYAGIDWRGYLGYFSVLMAAGGFILYVLTISWVFGREFADGTLKDMLAVPVPRWSILYAKFAVVAAWSLALSVIILGVGLLLGRIMALPGGTAQVILQGSGICLITACLTIVATLPFAFVASGGRGYLAPVGLAILTVMMTNIVVIAGRGEYFPWSVPALYAEGKSALPHVSYAIVLMTGILGMLATYLWWKYADQSR
jgi:ABC-2 type transport system permease protein